ncbi:hypothetical protein [Cytobacillus sp. S13-E01]|uniref:hypothetical protein n=1 Tax=Cytobacillus sp. S13-E01 TaxID=3031326 RepID=UPI0023D8817C|nr:hypothetical protein [Cytobacillus sp. S13-E01]
MSKRKQKEIHVDKLIVKTNEVIIIDAKKRGHSEPWLPRTQEELKVDVDVDAVAGDDVGVDVDVDSKSDAKGRRPFSWI